jgi:hypothetical protein
MLKRRRKPRTAIKILIIFSIVVLNLMGVGYSYWSTNLNIEALVQTGQLDVQFGSDSCYEVVNGSGDISVSLIDSRTLSIEGSVEEAVAEKVEETEDAFVYSPEYSDYQGRLWINIVNRGNVPAELKNNTFENGDGSVSASSIEQSKLLDPSTENLETAVGQQFVITAGAEDGPKSIDFTSDFLFTQPD